MKHRNNTNQIKARIMERSSTFSPCMSTSFVLFGLLEPWLFSAIHAMAYKNQLTLFLTHRLQSLWELFHLVIEMAKTCWVLFQVIFLLDFVHQFSLYMRSHFTLNVRQLEHRMTINPLKCFEPFSFWCCHSRKQ